MRTTSNSITDCSGPTFVNHVVICQKPILSQSKAKVGLSLHGRGLEAEGFQTSKCFR